MTLFRVSCLAYFFAFYWKWTFLIIGVTILINVGILWSCKCSPTITVLLGKVLKDFSIFKKISTNLLLHYHFQKLFRGQKQEFGEVRSERERQAEFFGEIVNGRSLAKT